MSSSEATANPADGPRVDRRALADDFMEMMEIRRSRNEPIDFESIVLAMKADRRRIISALRSHHRAFYVSVIAPEIRRKPKFPGGAPALAKYVRDAGERQLRETGAVSIRKIARSTGVSNTRVIAVLRQHQPDFYDAHVKDRTGRRPKLNGRLPENRRRPTSLTPKQVEAGSVFKRRLAGATWAESVAGTTLKVETAHAQVRVWGLKTGTDVSQAFTRGNSAAEAE